jgi:hypothetical protein
LAGSLRRLEDCLDRVLRQLAQELERMAVPSETIQKEANIVDLQGKGVLIT